MKPEELAAKLYELAEDMDAADYADTEETDIEKLSAELLTARETMPELFNILEIITA